MNENTSFTNNMNTLFTDLHDFVSTDTVLGNPLSVGNKTLVPVMSVTMGYGSTGMSTKLQNSGSNNANNATSGVGLGARVTTSAVVVIENDSVSMLPVNEKSNMEQLMNKLPEAVSSLGQSLSGGGMMSQGNNQGSQQGSEGSGSSQNKTQGSGNKQNSSNQKS